MTYPPGAGTRLRPGRPFNVRVGTGDAFAAGLIYGLSSGMLDKAALEFAAAVSYLKHSVPGDMNFCSVDEVKQLLAGSGAGRIQR